MAATERMDICSENPLKRPYQEDDTHRSIAQSVEPSESFPTPPLSASDKRNADARNASPAPSSSALSSITSHAEGPPETPGAPPKKRQKKSLAEQERERAAKEIRRREKEEKKAKREEEQRARDEEKRKKAEEREAKQREKDLKKAEKDKEKAEKEEAEARKQRSQMKLGAFFKTPTAPRISTMQSPARDNATKAISVEANDIHDTVMTSPVPKAQKSDYQKFFLPFELPSYTKLAPPVPHPPEDSSSAQRRFDSLLEERGDTQAQPVSPRSLFSEYKGRSRGMWQPNAKEVIESLQGSSSQPTDLTDEAGERYRREDLLGSITMRHLHFGEDVRPAYYGSYTKAVSPRKASKLRRRPCSRVRDDTDYDYDSEAEWEEPEEGEDLLSDGEEDDESVGSAEEMDGFLDDEEEDDIKRQRITSDLKPASTGICWEDSSGKSVTDQETGDVLSGMKLDFFLDLKTPSVNPFSDAYWPKPTSNASVPPPPLFSGEATRALHVEDGKVKLGRPPLQDGHKTSDATITGAAVGMKGPIMAVGRIKKPTSKLLAGQELESFEEAVVGSNLTKVDLLKALKQRFPKFTNAVIQATLVEYFERNDVQEDGKHWAAKSVASA